MRSPSRIWPDLSGSRLFRRSPRSCSISRIYSSQVVTRVSAGAGLRSHHYAACQSIRLDRSRNGPNGNSNIPCATEAPSAIRAPTGGAIPGRNRGGSEFRYRARMPSRAAAVRELLRRALVSVEEGRLTTLNEQGELPVLEWIAVSGLIQVHRGPRPQGAPAQPLRRGFIVLASLRCRRRRAPWLAAYRRRSSPRCWRRTCSPPRRRPASMMAKMTRRQTA
jgi:hypothetical protein